MMMFFFRENSVNRRTFSYLFSPCFIISLVFFISYFYSPILLSSETLVDAKPLTNPPDVSASILKVTVGLGLVVAAIFASAWFYRRFGNFSPISNDELKVIGGLSIGQKEKIVLLKVGDEQLLIGVAPGSIQKLHVLEKPLNVESSHKKENANFANQLNKAIDSWKKK